MANIKLPIAPAQNQLLEISPGRVLRHDNGRWRMHRNNVTQSKSGLIAPVAPITQDTAPALPHINPFWFNSAEAKLYVQYNDGNSTQWVAA